MKRIISLIMSVLMIATMFCGFAVTGNAADGVNYATTTVDVVDNGDGTYAVSVWATDETDFGFFKFGVKLDWDEDKLEVVTKTVGNNVGYFSIMNLYNWTTYMDTIKADTWVQPSIGGSNFNETSGRKVIDKFIYPNSAGEMAAILATATSGEYQYPMGWSAAFNNAYGVATSAYTWDENKGLLLATATFKAVEGATGEAKIYTEIFQAAVATSSDDLNATIIDGVANTTSGVGVITLGSAEPAYELNVEDGASIRKEYPEGMRFTASVTAADFSAIDEMGVAIVKAGTMPDEATTLKIPARVDTAGNYLHNYELNESGTKVFTDGVIAEAGTVKFTGVISNIKETNLSVEFTAYAYIKIDGEYTYSTTVCTRSYDAVLAKVVDDVFAE